MLRLLPCSPALAFLLFCSGIASAQPFLTADQLAFYKERSFSARGAETRLPINHLGIEGEWAAEGGYRITAALESYPAHAAGLQRGDVIDTFDGDTFHPVFSLNPELASGADRETSAWQGSVNLIYRRGAQRREVSVTPVFETLFDSYRTATANSVLRFAAGNKIIGYIRLWALSRSTDDLTSLSRLVAGLADTDGIVLDLRNSTGYLHSRHIDLFRASRSDYLQLETSNEGREGMERHLLLTLPRDSELAAYRRPMAILIDSSTSGSAALLAHQLGKLARITTVGSKTSTQFGRYELASSSTADSADNGPNSKQDEADVRGGAYSYRPADELSVDGKLLEGTGVEPERLSAYPFTQTSRADPQFQLAVDILMGVI